MRARNYHTAATKMAYIYADGTTYEFAVHNTSTMPYLIMHGLERAVRVEVIYKDNTYHMVADGMGGYTRTKV